MDYIPMAEMSGVGGIDKLKLSVSITKLDNGYTLSLVEPPKSEAPEPEKQDPVVAATSPPQTEDEKIDALVDGLAAFLQYVNGKGTDGEEWKDHGDIKEKMRAGFKTLYPGAARSLHVPRLRPMPRHEEMVFGGKEELLAYLAKNL